MEIMITNPDGVKLKTANKYCSEDINIYPILQEKTATINNTDITIDQGYAGLSVVHVAVPESGGGAEFNIAYGDTPPTDTSKLWIKSTKPSHIEFSRNPEQQVQGLEVLDKYLPTAAHDIAAAAVGTKIYLFGGYSSGYLDAIQEFDTEIKTIITLSAKLPTAASQIAAAAVGTKIYLFGGDRSGYLDAILEFDTETKTITTISGGLTGRFGIGAAAVGTKIYLFGGSRRSSSSVSVYDTILEFDTETKTIITLSAKLPTAAHGIAAAAVGTKIYLFGGGSSTIQEFDTETKTIAFLSATLRAPTDYLAAAAVGTKIYLFGGIIIQEFIVSFPLVANNILAYQDYNNNIFAIVPSPTKVEIGVKNVYKGNASNVAEFVDAYLYNGTNWANINTQEIYTTNSD